MLLLLIARVLNDIHFEKTNSYTSIDSVSFSTDMVYHMHMWALVSENLDQVGSLMIKSSLLSFREF